ncbi:MAG: PEP-CTERM sorting domain-containing protein [Candidatus Didemnitutus sp.]|nr:PEP-CTERM sorting domain-containing protein [Candidatus Didemnitutus sp.]
MAQANVTIFAAYNFEDPTNATNFYSDSSGNGHNMPDSTGFGITSSNLAPTGGSYAFNGAGGGLFAWNVTGGSVNQATNWGLELLFKNPGSTSSTVSTEIFSVGDANINGMSILYNPATNRIEGKLNGIQAFGSATYTPGAWNSVSLVNNGTTTTLWVNYAVAATLNSNPTVPNSVWHAFVISGGAVSYTGLADNVRVFTFTGDYTAANISAIPEPSTYAALAGLLAIGAVAWRRRVR